MAPWQTSPSSRILGSCHCQIPSPAWTGPTWWTLPGPSKVPCPVEQAVRPQAERLLKAFLTQSYLRTQFSTAHSWLLLFAFVMLIPSHVPPCSVNWKWRSHFQEGAIFTLLPCEEPLRKMAASSAICSQAHGCKSRAIKAFLFCPNISIRMRRS